MGIAYNSSIVRDGLVLHLDAANQKSYPGSGTTCSDLSGNGNNGTLVNGVGYSTDNKGSLTFDGGNDYINLGTSLNIAVQTYTVMGWIYKTGSSTNNAAYIISGGYGGDRDGIMISTEVYATTNDIYISDLTVGTQVFHNGEPVATGTNFNLNEWLFFTVIYPVESVDGGDHNIGRNNNNTNHFQGLISSLQVYDRQLTESEIRQNFESTRGRYGI